MGFRPVAHHLMLRLPNQNRSDLYCRNFPMNNVGSGECWLLFKNRAPASDRRVRKRGWTLAMRVPCLASTAPLMSAPIHRPALIVADRWRDYQLIDCGDGMKQERWGDVTLVRPDPQVIWPRHGNPAA